MVHIYGLAYVLSCRCLYTRLEPVPVPVPVGKIVVRGLVRARSLVREDCSQRQPQLQVAGSSLSLSRVFIMRVCVCTLTTKHHLPEAPF